MHCPRAPKDRASEGHRPKNRHPQKRKGKLVFCRPRASRSSSHGRDVGLALPGLRLLLVPVGGSGCWLLVPCRSCRPPVFSGVFLRNVCCGHGRRPHKRAFLSGVPVVTIAVVVMEPTTGSSFDVALFSSSSFHGRCSRRRRMFIVIVMMRAVHRTGFIPRGLIVYRHHIRFVCGRPWPGSCRVYCWRHHELFGFAH